MAKEVNPKIDAAGFLQELVEACVDDGATLIDVQRVRDGLEITPMYGNSGTGRVFDDAEFERALFRFVDRNAKRRRGSGDSLQIPVHGKPKTIEVQWYDSFGETCFRLVLKDGARQPSAGGFDEAFDDEQFDDEQFGEFTAECAGCDMFGRVDSQGLCDGCAGKLERDLIRLRDWDYTAAGFGLPVEQREPLRAKIIAEFGSAMELIADPREAESKSRQAKRKMKRKRRANSKRKRPK